MAGSLTDIDAPEHIEEKFWDAESRAGQETQGKDRSFGFAVAVEQGEGFCKFFYKYEKPATASIIINSDL